VRAPVSPTWVRDRLKNGVGASILSSLSIRQGEGARTILLFVLLLCSSAVFVMGRTVRDTLFLSRYPISALPWMFVAYGVASAVTVVVYSRVAVTAARHSAIIGWSALGILTYLGTWLLVQAETTWIYPVFYVWSEVFANLLISQFWTLANELCDARAGKRLFPTIGSARVLGVIVVGLATGSVVRLIGTAQLLFVLVGLLAVVAGIALRLGRETKEGKPPPKGRERKTKAPTSVLSDPYLWALATMLFAAFAALTIGDYQFKAIARAAYKEDALAAFFSFFYAGTGIVSFLFQLFVTPRLLARFGVSTGMSVMPAVFGGACAALLGFPSLAIATVMKFADNGLQYTIHDTTMQALYVPFAADVKVRARAFLDAVAKPLSYGLGGVLLVVFAERLGPAKLGFVSVALVAIWLGAIPLVKRRYMQKLASTLRAGGFATLSEEAITDAGRRTVLLAALGSEDPHLVLAALDELGAIDDPAGRAALKRLGSHPDPAIRVAAITRLSEGGEPASAAETLSVLEGALTDPVTEVRAAAVSAYAAARLDEAVDALSPALEDPEPTVRSAALSGLLRYAGFEGAMVAGTRLAQLLESTSAHDRSTAAHALGAIGPSGTRRLSVLLNDPEESVQNAALRAAAQVGDARLVPRLIECLRQPSMQKPAQAALAATGAACIEPLSQILLDPHGTRALRLAIPRILRQITTTESYAALRAAAQVRDGQVRLRVFSALSRVRERLAGPPETLDAVRTWIEREVRESISLAASYERARAQIGTPLLDDAIAFSVERGGRRILRILELRGDPSPLRLVRAKIDAPARRANALEVLDSSLEPNLRPVVIPFFDDVPAGDKLKRYGLSALSSTEELLEEHLTSTNPYTLMAALDAVREHRCAFAIVTVRKLLGHEYPVVREGALLALATLEPSNVQELAKQLADDGDRQVARIALHLMHPEAHVYTTVEKLLMLRAAPMFAKIRSEDLAPLAQVAEVERFRAGECIFEAGDHGDALFVVARGSVAIMQAGQALATLGRGDAFGEMSVLDAEPRSASAVAVEDTELLRIGSEEFYEVLREQVEIAEGVIHVLSGRLRDANKSLERLARD